MEKFIKHYISNLQKVLDELNLTVISEIIDELESVHKKNSKIYIIGNGGSAATASHMAK